MPTYRHTYEKARRPELDFALSPTLFPKLVPSQRKQEAESQCCSPVKYCISLGFTLAEVLITLGIVGVVCAITIPTLIHNYQVSVYRSKLKETYSLLNQATNQLFNNNNMDLASYGDCGHPTLRNAYASYLKGTITTQPTNTTYATFYKTTQSSWWANMNAPYILANGVYIGFYVNYGECTNATVGQEGDISIDLDGWSKGINQQGMDVHTFIFNKLANGTYALSIPKESADYSQCTSQHLGNNALAAMDCTYNMLYDKPIP